MKKILIVFLFVLGMNAYANNKPGSDLLAVSQPTYNQVNKIKGGLFGYRSVTTDKDTHGNTITMCQNPGLKRCIVNAFVIDETPWTAEESENLDRYVTSLITPENTSGTFLYDGSVVVTYKYNVDTNGLSYNVYSIQSATENGITW